jgi:hypothetical protein
VAFGHRPLKRRRRTASAVAAQQRREGGVTMRGSNNIPPSPTLPRKGGGSGETVCAKYQSHHRSFKVERPASASITEMIQNRITICGSVQPNCSKWWWIGAILKMRFPVSLKDAT